MVWWEGERSNGQLFICPSGGVCAFIGMSWEFFQWLLLLRTAYGHGAEEVAVLVPVFEPLAESGQLGERGGE